MQHLIQYLPQDYRGWFDQLFDRLSVLHEPSGSVLHFYGDDFIKPVTLIRRLKDYARAWEESHKEEAQRWHHIHPPHVPAGE